MRGGENRITEKDRTRGWYERRVEPKMIKRRKVNREEEARTGLRRLRRKQFEMKNV